MTFRVGPAPSSSRWPEPASSTSPPRRNACAGRQHTSPCRRCWTSGRARLGVATHRGLPGVSAVHPRWVAAPDVAVRAIGVGCAHCTSACRSERAHSTGLRKADWRG
ncbi:putative phosphotransferase [Mycobacterium ulcerans str. Harvey]|uniref:Phosphotransferase n=1 Tax=Mycobacterium ulcerans str. Harvey TaxID=1299332 RepID=A0ABP3A216_MYCUL|nr:putative phosphotransferase [Mycobacterium ulcerans str. Harvey]